MHKWTNIIRISVYMIYWHIVDVSVYMCVCVSVYVRWVYITYINLY